METLEVNLREVPSYFLLNAEQCTFPEKILHIMKDEHGNFAGVRFQMGEPWYTATPISVLVHLRVVINGVEVEPVHFSLREQELPLAYVKNMHEIWWHMGESAWIICRDPKLEALLSTSNPVELHFGMRTALDYGVPGKVVYFHEYAEMEVQ